MESLLDFSADWVFPWEATEMSGQQGSSGLSDLSSACSESPWLEGIDVGQSTILLSQSLAVDSKDDFTLIDPFQPFSDDFFINADSSSYVDSIPSMSPENLNHEPLHLYEKDIHYNEFDSSSPEYATLSPSAGYVPSSDYAGSPTIYHNPSLDYTPHYQSVADYQIQSPIALNFEDISSDILAVLSDQNFKLLPPESELLPGCEDDIRFSSTDFNLPMYEEASNSPFVQEVPEEPVGLEGAELKESDAGLLEEGPDSMYMRSILEELIGAPELLSPVSSDDVDSILSSNSLNLSRHALLKAIPQELNSYKSELQASCAVNPEFFSIIDMNPSSCDSMSTSSYDGCGSESVVYVSNSYKYMAMDAVSSSHAGTPYARPDRRLKKKEQNKTAALRYRHKKREQKGVALTEVEQLELRNAELKDRAADLTREINYLKGLMEEIIKT